MEIIKILVVEDDPFIAQEITDYLYELDYTVLGICRSVEQARKILEKEVPDLILMDIELQGKESGVDLAQEIRNKKIQVPIVFLTSMADPRIIASVKETQPDGYIVKPFDERDLRSNIEIALYRFSQQSGDEEAPQKSEGGFLMKNFYFIRGKNNLIKIDLQKIIWAEADDNYTYLHLENEKHILSSTLKQVEEKLPKDDFIRIHRSYLINLNYLDKLEDQYVHLGKKALPIGKSYRQELLKMLNLL